MSASLLVFDTETTAADPEEARIVSSYLGLLAADGSVEMEQEWLVKPDGFEVTKESTAIHGITHEHAAAHGLPLTNVLLAMANVITQYAGTERRPLVGQNVSYDLTVLDREAARALPGATVQQLLNGVNVLDTYVLDKELYRFRRGAGARKLINLAAAYDVHLTEAEAHGARADAIAAGRIAQAQLRNPKLRGYSPARLHQAQIGWKRVQSADLQAWFRTKAPADRRDPQAIVSGDWPFIPREERS